MKAQTAARGALPQIIRNDAGLYEGDLRHYFQSVFNTAQNLQKPYHNFRHMMHVTVMVYYACKYYFARAMLTPRQMRSLLIAAMYHDFDHPGMRGSDDLNIGRALRGLDTHLLQVDRAHRDEIAEFIRATEYPYKIEADRLTLSEKIMRDADMSQLMSVAWIQSIVFGLAEEWGKTPLEVLKGQVGFARNLVFHTAWGKETFPQEMIDDKVREIQELVELLEMRAAA